METGGIPKIQNTYNTVPLMDLVRPSLNSGTIDLPVDHYAPFTYFKYINAVPARSEGGGYPLAKLAALDALIGHLVLARQAKQEAVPEINAAGLSEGAMDELIKQVSSQLHATLQLSMPAVPQSLGVSMGTAIPATGLVVNTLA